MELVKSTDPVLKRKCDYFDFHNPPFDPIEFSHELVKCMYEHNGLGLAANQVGISLRIFALRGSPQNYVCFNPRIVWTSEEEVLLEEGCLTYPNLIAKVKRPRFIRARFNLPNGTLRTEKFIGMTARCFQHEFDHLEGIVFYEKANRYHREQAFKRRKQIEKGDIAYKLKHNLDTFDLYDIPM